MFKLSIPITLTFELSNKYFARLYPMKPATPVINIYKNNIDISILIHKRYKYFMLKICVIGLGYVGLPICLKLAKNFKTIGFDIDSKRIDTLKNQIDINNEFKKRP